MHFLFYWTGAIVWWGIFMAVAVGLGWAVYAVTLATVRTCSVLRFTLAIRRKSVTPAPPAQWVHSIIWIFKQMWDANEPEILGREGSKWKGIGKWSINDEPFPPPETQSTIPTDFV